MTTYLGIPYPDAAMWTHQGHIELEGCDLVELAERYGTPVLVVSERQLRSAATRLLTAVDADVSGNDVLFGSKAFPCLAVLRVFAEEGLGCDVTSEGELAYALKAGFAPTKLHFHGNAKTASELSQAYDVGVGHIVIDSFDDISRLSEICSADKPQKVLLRVTPGVVPATHHSIVTGHSESKFGLPVDVARDAITQIRATTGLELTGLHVHIGSQLLDLSPMESAISELAKLGTFDMYNLGGGLGVAYLASDEPPGLESYAKFVLDAARRHLGDRARIVIEPGRALVASAALTLYRVQTVKRHGSRPIVAVDGGMSDNLRPALYGAVYEACLANRRPPGQLTSCRLVGKHCESGDVLIEDADLADPNVGDLVAVPVTGAYTLAIGNNFNGALRSPVVFCRDGVATEVVRRETVSDLLARELA